MIRFPPVSPRQSLATSATRRLSVVVLAGLALATSCASPTRADDQEQPVVTLWPGDVPGERGDVGEEQVQPPRPDESRGVTRITNVTRPTLTVFKAPADSRNGTAVVVCPGGGYNILAWDLEGEEVARWLNSIGVTAFVLKYRVPRRAERPKHEAPLQDAQRALSLVRSQSGKWNVDPERIGILGFSAGGHLSASAATNFDRRQYEAADEIDQTSCRPDFAVLVYPAYLVEGDALTPEIRVTENTPPVFFAHAGDDRIGPENSIGMYEALKRAGVAAELHVYSAGGHGFGLRPSDLPCSQWPKQCEAWLRSQDLLGD